MSGSQLNVEYEGMADRHELYAKYGIAAEAAQLFETELGTLLLCLRALDEGWHIMPEGEAAREVLDTIDRSTLGRALNDLKRHITIEGDLEEGFSSALKARNQLMHGFFERHNFKIQTEDGRKEMIADLDSLHGELFVAWRAADKLVTIISAVVRLRAENGA
ncbi:hypothetical protein [Novosphingobium sp. EMRT-2]|uniref:hypothetical protein n=1 Tax=Novosphingobium sp. EMRT-2 TaxID=2571749 RepID=UPI0010BD1F8B|nr:hypothetical protein [Novosphingobium sp. EMRT-2]QCI94527.1 hypothetical protein FA702_13925 [Novosphingobium sp. EMRT-2]